MKNYEYTKPFPSDFEMQHEHETVDLWLSEVADVEESLEFLNDKEFHAEMCFSYIKDMATYSKYCCPPIDKEYWGAELDFCGITDDELDETLSIIKEDYEYANGFDAAYVCLKNRFWDDSIGDIIISELSEKFYKEFCEVDPDDFVEEDNEEEI